MPDDILTAIQELSNAIIQLRQETSVVNKIDVQPICCEDAPPMYDEDPSPIEVGEGDPPEPYVDWPEYLEDHCQRSHTAVMLMRKSIFQLWDLAEIGTATITLGTILAILALVSAPWAVAAAILGLLVGGSFEIGILFLKGYYNAEYENFVCAIHGAETVNSAKTRIDAVIEDSDLDALSKAILTKAWHNGILNKVFDQTLPIDPAAPTSCAFCGPTTLLETTHASPYNVMVQGTLEVAEYSQASQGYGSQNTVGDVHFLFTPVQEVATFDLSMQFGWSTTPGETINCVVQIARVDEPFTVVYNSGPIFSFVTPNFESFLVEDITGPFLAGVTYRAQFEPNSFQRIAFARDITITQKT